MVFAIDNSSVFMMFILAYVLRYNFDLSILNFPLVVKHSFGALLIYSIFSVIFRSYSGLLRHTTLTDISLVFIVTTCSALSLVILSLLGRALSLGDDFILPLSVVLIHYVSISVFLFFLRVFVKIVFRFATSSMQKTRNVIIYGAGDLGFVVKRVILSDSKYGFNVDGFIDKDKSLQGKKINGIPVYSDSILTSDFIQKRRIESLILAEKEITIDEKSRIIRSAIKLGLEVLDTPEVDKWMAGQLNTRHFQRVKLEDLLGRDPIKLNIDLIKEGLNQKIILITGAAGSIGSEIVRQLSRFTSKKVILVDQAETPMFYLEKELKEKFLDLKFELILADVTNYDKMERIFMEFHPDIVFHAAAYKHVSLMEENPHEAIRVNVGGTMILTELAIKYGTEKFVMISSDKAVNPTGVMGASKRICEKIIQAIDQVEGKKTQFIVTRFGNVLGSNGSVIPIFSKQIQDGGPVTVTHPDVYRYFMTIPEACQLVLEAGFMGQGGEIFVFDMGDPVRITDLVNNMVQLSGLIPGKDIQIVFTGLRPGEKLFEELLTDKEATIVTHHPKILKARIEEINGPKVLAKIDDLLYRVYSLSDQQILGYMKDLVPEYNCSQIG
jgi:FlaA1/EpsC-like NDP-sugar epimerase